jgi:hypothetical protein
MTDLTGAPAFDLDIEEEGENEMWERLVKSDKRGYVMAASAGTTDASGD